MKSHSAAAFRIRAFAALALFMPQLACAADRPPIDVARAAKIATEYLTTRGANAPFIVSVTLEKSAILHGQSSWVARWSKAIPADGDEEVGLRVNFDGTTARLVLPKDAARKRMAGPSGVR